MKSEKRENRLGKRKIAEEKIGKNEKNTEV